MQGAPPSWRKRVVSAVAEGAASSGALAWLDREPSGPAQLLRVLTYHRIAEPDGEPAPCPSLLSATPADFAMQMQCLREHYQVVPVQAVLEAVRGGRALPPRAVLITFDDAYCDFAEHAWPVLRRLELPVTLFVPTAYPDAPERSFWWDRLHQALAGAKQGALHCDGKRLPLGSARERRQAYAQLRDKVKSLPHDVAMDLVDVLCDELGQPSSPNLVLSWDALRRLAREGVTLGAHTRTHPMLHRLDPARVREEAARSRADLEREIGKTLPIFAYPSGGFDARTLEALAAEGFELAFTTQRGINDLRRPRPLQLRRTSVVHRMSEPLLRAQLLSLTRGLQRFIA